MEEGGVLVGRGGNTQSGRPTETETEAGDATASQGGTSTAGGRGGPPQEPRWSRAPPTPRVWTLDSRTMSGYVYVVSSHKSVATVHGSHRKSIRRFAEFSQESYL